MIRRTPSRRGFTLIEAAVSCVIVAVMLTAALSTAAAAKARQQKAVDRQRALFLAQSLMSEITDKLYVDPGLLPLFGPELAEAGQPRSVYNDVDDYDGLNESPPKYADGTPISGYSRWSRSVTVQWVQPNNTASASLLDTGVKLITVTVKKNGVPQMVLKALRSQARDSL